MCVILFQQLNQDVLAVHKKPAKFFKLELLLCVRVCVSVVCGVSVVGRNAKSN